LGARADHSELMKVRQMMDELMWLQRSRVAWLKERDHNKKYFHRKAAHRAKKNIIKLKTEMEGMAWEFFKSLYMTYGNVSPEDLLQTFKLCISEDDNQGLCKPFSYNEISDALFQIGPLKAYGPDGFPGRFFQRNWSIMKPDIIRGVKNFETSHCDRTPSEMRGPSSRIWIG
jgi:hypothetical protein